MAPDRLVGNIFAGLSAATGLVATQNNNGNAEGPNLWKILAKIIIVIMLLGWVVAGGLIKLSFDSIMDGQKTMIAELKPLCNDVAVVKYKQELLLKENENQWTHIYELERNHYNGTKK